MTIAIWGNAGSGTSTLAIKLALLLTKIGKSTLVIDTNFVTPQINIWYPDKKIRLSELLSNILANNIDMEVVATKITVINDDLGVLGYAKDLSINSITVRDDTPMALLNTANSIVDITIVDCQTNITQDVMSFIALDSADIKILNLTPDLRGLSWYESNVMMLREKWESQNDKIIKVFNKVRPNSPTNSIESVIGAFGYHMPFCEEIDEELYNGTLGTINNRGRLKYYNTILKTLCHAVDGYWEARFEKEPAREDEEIPTVEDIMPEANVSEDEITNTAISNEREISQEEACDNVNIEKEKEHSDKQEEVIITECEETTDTQVPNPDDDYDLAKIMPDLFVGKDD